MGARRTAAIALSGALAIGGAGAAIAAVTNDDRDEAEQAVLDDAAKRLDVTPQRLRAALAAAQDAQLDQAVKDGVLTREQADAIKAARRRSGHVLGGPRMHGGPPRLRGGGRGAHGLGLRRGLMRELAGALGTTPAKLREQLRAGDSLADVAKANGMSLDDVRSAVNAAVKRRLDKAVDDGDLTRRQADRIREHLAERLEQLDADRPLLPRRHRRGHRGGVPPGALRPGALVPGEDVPPLAPRGGSYS